MSGKKEVGKWVGGWVGGREDVPEDGSLKVVVALAGFAEHGLAFHHAPVGDALGVENHLVVLQEGLGVF